ncbi:HlyC/CorC family transporter [Xanthobacter dioxanivorans]|uniref:HlyC/CorC family transporter n=1 Tax=Xanthobacter dioxanivorans TaxID=2528964 RepID=A0A974PS69_9HYPH|nr:hemolysin family protein [Xanthobacter dioxanivorans]QRG08180.1 HlyC/CorC family transporter [Xanthobacter dioxanivorans]
MSNIDQPTETSSSEPPSFLDRLRALLGTFRPHGSLRTDLVEVLDAAETPEEEGEFTSAERKMLRNILHLKEVGIGDIMVPRAEIVAVRRDISLGELLKQFVSIGHSRLVVYNDTLDDPVGMVHVRDLIAVLVGDVSSTPGGKLDLGSVNLDRSLDEAGLVRRLLYVPPSMPAVDLLVAMQAARTHLALVIDEYGGTDGLVSIEDVVEEIVGEIEDEHDEAADTLLVRQPDGSFLADARTPLEAAVEVLGSTFATEEALDEVDSLGGLLVSIASRVPRQGETISLPGGFAAEVLEADPRRVKKLRIIPPREAPIGADDAGEPQA